MLKQKCLSLKNTFNSCSTKDDIRMQKNVKSPNDIIIVKGMNDSMSEEASEQKRTEKDRKENASIQEPENNDTTK